ncbi:LysR family transcriptional regulator [Pseudahrensia aquimaris]|uniref:LysR family transcriptional regulator n=1 Tax=Pseudahrensia aquimaris TaxID=744461 RepID=A0ABW3FFA1_9HYPH
MRHDLFSLDLFISISETGNIADAAQRHSIVASAASKRISDMEKLVGAKLLHRQRRGVSLTAAGEDLLVHALRIRQSVELLNAEMGSHASGMRGAIRIAANPSSITQFLPEDLAGFVSHYPEIRIQLVELNSPEIIERVRSGTVDLGLYSGFTDASGLETLVYRTDTLVVCAPADHRLAIRGSLKLTDLMDDNFVGLQSGSSIQAHLENSALKNGKRLRTIVEVMSFDGVRRMVEARLGIAILPRGVVEPYLAGSALKMVDIAEPWATRQLRIAFRDRNLLSAQAQLLLDMLCDDKQGSENGSDGVSDTGIGNQ